MTHATDNDDEDSNDEDSSNNDSDNSNDSDNDDNGDHNENGNNNNNIQEPPFDPNARSTWARPNLFKPTITQTNAN